MIKKKNKGSMLKKKYSSAENIEKDNKNKIITDGVIKETLPGARFKVEVDFQGTALEINAYLSGKMRANYIKIISGDKVKIELDIYDLNNGRIIYRY